MGAGFARIPIIQQQVATPGAPAPAMRSEALSASPLTGIAKDIGEQGAAIRRIFEVQGKNQQILDQNDAEAQWKAGHASNVEVVKASGAPGATWAETVAEQDRKLAEGIQNDPKFSRITGQLGARFAALQQLTSMDVAHQGAVQTAKDQHDQYVGQQKGRATEAGANFTYDPATGTFADNARAQAINAKENLDGKGLWGNNPTAMAFHQKLYEDEKTLQRAQAIAQGSASAPFLLDKFIKSQPVGTFTPMQIKGFQELQRTAIEQPYHMTTAEHESQVAQHIAAIQNAPPEQRATLASQAIGEGWITAEYGRQWGGKWRDPGNGSAPGLVKKYTDEITADPFKYSAADINAIPKEDLSPDDRHALQAARYDGVKAAKQPLNAEFLNSRRIIKDAGAPGLVNFNAAATKQKVDDATNDLDVMMKSGQLQSAKDVIDARNQIIKQYFPKPKKPVAHVTNFKPSAIPPGTAARIAADARKDNFTGDTSGGD